MLMQMCNYYDPAFSNPAIVYILCSHLQIHFVEESELVILILTNTLAEVQPILQSLRL